jgi:hypothetical protein
MNETIKQINDLEKTKQKLVKKLKTEFDKELKNIFKKYPDIVSVSVAINNHEFNDGDTTSFDVYYEDLELMDSAGECIDNDEAVEAVDELIALFEQTNVIDAHESWFGGHYGEILFKRKEYLKG